MTPAEHDLASLRRVCDRAEERRHALHDALSAVCAADLDATRARARLDRIRAVCDDLAARRGEAFAVLAAERAAASPVRLVPRELTPAEASALAAAEERLDTARTILGRDESFDHGLQRGLLRAIESGAESYAEECREAIVSGYAYTDRARANVTAALDARAPLLAARWQEVAT